MAKKSMKQRIIELEVKLGPQKLKAIDLLLDKQMRPKRGEDKGKTMEQIAAEVGVSHMSIHRWKNDDEFIELKNLYAERILSESIPTVHGVLLKSIKSKQPSMKALEMFYKLHSMLNDKQIVENVNDVDKRDDASVSESLAELDALLDEKDGGKDGVT